MLCGLSEVDDDGGSGENLSVLFIFSLVSLLLPLSFFWIYIISLKVSKKKERKRRRRREVSKKKKEETHCFFFVEQESYIIINHLDFCC